jgi:hypothetical protein
VRLAGVVADDDDEVVLALAGVDRLQVGVQLRLHVVEAARLRLHPPAIALVRCVGREGEARRLDDAFPFAKRGAQFVARQVELRRIGERPLFAGGVNPDRLLRLDAA